ncbi:MAG: site-specific integrase [Bacteroidetes bacterium]|nr:site-specific integrase [Bacteroidota bacterium]
MRLTFYTDRKDAPITAIMVNVAFAGQRFRFSTGVSIPPEHWNHDAQEVRKADANRAAHNKRLAAVQAEMRSAYNDISFGADGKVVSKDALKLFTERIKTFLDGSQNALAKDDVQHQFERFIREYRKSHGGGLITNETLGTSTINRYKLVQRRLRDFALKERLDLTFDAIDARFYRAFVTWLSEDVGVKDSSVGNHIKVIKTFMRWAEDQGLHANKAYVRFFKPESIGDTIALSSRELRMIRDVDLSDSLKLQRVRDHFLMQTYTGLRYGDLIKLQPQHFDLANGFIHVPITKTDTRPIIPISPPLRVLLASYPSLLFEFNSSVKANVYLKELGKRAGLDSPVVIGYSKNGQRIEETVPKYHELTTHVARRSFVTISLEFGVQESIIRHVTGHKTGDVLGKHYAKPNHDTVRDTICEAWRKL